MKAFILGKNVCTIQKTKLSRCWICWMLLNINTRCTAFRILFSQIIWFLKPLRQEAICKVFCSDTPTLSKLIYHDALGLRPQNDTYVFKALPSWCALGRPPVSAGLCVMIFTVCNANRYHDGTFPRFPSHRRGQRSPGEHSRRDSTAPRGLGRGSSLSGHLLRPALPQLKLTPCSH